MKEGKGINRIDKMRFPFLILCTIFLFMNHVGPIEVNLVGT